MRSSSLPYNIAAIMVCFTFEFLNKRLRRQFCGCTTSFREPLTDVAPTRSHVPTRPTAGDARSALRPGSHLAIRFPPTLAANQSRRYRTRRRCALARKSMRRTTRKSPAATFARKSITRPPGREASTAFSTIRGAEAATMTRSAPRPPVLAANSAATSVSSGFQHSTAPIRCEASTRGFTTSVAKTCSTPAWPSSIVTATRWDPAPSPVPSRRG